MIPAGVQWIWAGLLVVVYLSLPVAVAALHRLWRSARNIERYFAEMETAAAGIARGTGSLEDLETTIQGAGQLLEAAAGIAHSCAVIHKTLAARAHDPSGEEGR